MHTKATFTTHRLVAALALLLLAGCDIPGVIPDPRVVQRDSDAKAVGGGCRHALRGLEDCYTLNPKAPKAAIFAGWKDMDAYMRENNIAAVPPEPPPPEPKKADGEDGEAPTEKSAEKR